MTYKTGNLPAPFKRYGVATTLIHEKNHLRLFYHVTEIAAVHKTPLGFMLYLQHNGWNTSTTKKRINAFLSYCQLPFFIYQKNFTWYIYTPDGTIEWQYKEIIFNVTDLGIFQTNKFKIT